MYFLVLSHSVSDGFRSIPRLFDGTSTPWSARGADRCVPGGAWCVGRLVSLPVEKMESKEPLRTRGGLGSLMQVCSIFANSSWAIEDFWGPSMLLPFGKK